MKKVPINNYLNVNGLNALIKIRKIAEWIRNHEPHICCLQQTHHRKKDLHTLKVKGWKKYSQQMDKGKKTEIAIFISDKLDFKTRTIKRDPEGHFIIHKEKYINKT